MTSSPCTVAVSVGDIEGAKHLNETLGFISQLKVSLCSQRDSLTVPLKNQKIYVGDITHIVKGYWQNPSSHIKASPSLTIRSSPEEKGQNPSARLRPFILLYD